MHARTVLLIDGDSDSLNIYSLLLEHYGFQVLRATRSDQGIRLARDHRPDLVIAEPFADVGPDGATLRDALRGDPSTSELPVLLITAVPALLQSTEFRMTPRDRYLVKPCPPQRVLEEVELLLDKAVGASR